MSGDAAKGGTATATAFFQAEDGIRGVERSRGLGDVYKRQYVNNPTSLQMARISLIDEKLD